MNFLSPYPLEFSGVIIIIMIILQPGNLRLFISEESERFAGDKIKWLPKWDVECHFQDLIAGKMEKGTLFWGEMSWNIYEKTIFDNNASICNIYHQRVLIYTSLYWYIVWYRINPTYNIRLNLIIHPLEKWLQNMEAFT